MYKPNMEDKRVKVTIVNKSTVTLHGLKPEGKLKIEVDENGTPLDLNWRRRMRDSKRDGCIEVLKEEKKVEKKTKPKQEDKN